MLLSYPQGLNLLSAFLLLTSSRVSSSVLEKPDDSVVNGTTTTTRVTEDFGISHLNSTNVSTIDGNYSSIREPKILTHTVNPLYVSWNITNSNSNTSNSYTALPANLESKNAFAGRSDRNESTGTKNLRSVFKVINSGSRTSGRRKYPNHHYAYRSDEKKDKRKSYTATNEDYEQQTYSNAALQQQQQTYNNGVQQQQHQTYTNAAQQQQTYNNGAQQVALVQDYYTAVDPPLDPPQTTEYEETYNTIPEGQVNTGYNNGQVADPYRVSYVPAQDPEYFGPPITTEPTLIEREPPQVITVVRECVCPIQATRSYECDSPSTTFLSLVSDLWQNLWALIKLIATSAAPFIIPLLAIKMIIVPLKILKFIKLMKLFVKLFIILPLFIRYVYPALSNSFNLQNFLFQQTHGTHTTSHHPHPHQGHSNDVESRTAGNVSSIYLDETNMWDLGACPRRVACELGAFLSTSSHTNLPQNIVNYLTRKADKAEGKLETSDTVDSKGNDEEDIDERVERDEAFKAFVIALGKKWTLEKCGIYQCALLF